MDIEYLKELSRDFLTPPAALTAQPAVIGKTITRPISPPTALYTAKEVKADDLKKTLTNCNVNGEFNTDCFYHRIGLLNYDLEKLTTTTDAQINTILKAKGVLKEPTAPTPPVAAAPVAQAAPAVAPAAPAVAPAAAAAAPIVAQAAAAAAPIVAQENPAAAAVPSADPQRATRSARQRRNRTFKKRKASFRKN